MSVNAMAWAKRQVCGNATLKAVLLAVADYADEEGKAWPSQKRLAADTELDRRTIQRALDTLEERGLLRREVHIRDDNSRGADRIFLALTPGGSVSRGGGTEPPPSGTRSRGTAAQSPGGGGTVSTLTTFEPPLEPSEEPSLGRAEARTAQVIPLHPDTKPAKKRGHRLPADFQLTPEDIAHARKEGFTDEHIRRQFDQFRDHWAQAAGPNAIKLDWHAAWRTWIRKAADGFGGSRGHSPAGHGSPPGGRFGAMQRALARIAHSDPVPE